MHTIACCLVVRLGLRLGLGSDCVWLVSCYEHAFVLLSVVIVTPPLLQRERVALEMVEHREQLIRVSGGDRMMQLILIE